MTTTKKRVAGSQAGFTLVELAIVMIIIGLLIGGVLKGQELIGNARITSTVSQIKGIDAATSTFRDMYAAMPGDMVGPAGRLPNCTGAPCNVAGNGDNRVTGAVTAAATGEMNGFWSHMAAADLITGIDPLSATTAIGDRFPAASIAGGFNAAYQAGGALGANGAARGGHYLGLTANPTAGVPAAAGTTLLPNQAFRIDSKIDDGIADNGSVFASGGACQAAGAYAENAGAANCDLLIRFQN